MMQPYLDGILTDEQVREAKGHLERCPPCDKRFRFELHLRHFVRVAVDEDMPPGLRQKLSSLRST
ncbi:MAG: zf-HC2 domain-containing protein [Actinobacteria bacterium]|nr:zf-HC2 domain-containing protein [Actinomycetota bacterium]